MAPMNGIDLTSKASEVRFKDVCVPEENVVGEMDAGWPVVQEVLQKAAVGASAEMLGCARRCNAPNIKVAAPLIL
jgi:alkylation response protein AidB-like acyl-CoA dehydrogenase